MPKPIWQFVRVVKEHATVLWTSSLALLLVGIMQGFSPPGHAVWFIVAYAVIAVVGLFFAFYRAWNDQRLAKEKALTALAELARPSRVTSEDWTGLADRFKEIGLDVSAQWQCNRRNNQTISEDWNFSGQYQKPCEALCKFAGALLLKSPNVCPTLSHSALQQLSPAWRWLFFLKENHKATDLGAGMALAGGDGTNYFSERISNLAAVSARVCMECAALEL